MTNYIITEPGFISSLFDELNNNPHYKIIARQELMNSDVSFDCKDKIYVPFEESLDEVYKHHQDEKWIKKIKTMRDKYEFRKLLKAIYSNFYCEKISSNDISKLKIPENKKVVIKPLRGFLSSGVNFADSSTDLEQLSHKLQAEIYEKSKYFTNAVISSEEVIVEEFIDGNEYASDIYITSDNQIVILNITAHPNQEKFFSVPVLYYTNYKIYSNLYKKIYEIIKSYNNLVDIRNIPINAEFKLKDEQLIPIEFNPVRFGGGGYCDITYYFFEVNPFKSFFEEENTNPSQLWQGKYDKSFGWVLAYNVKGLNINNYKLDYDRIKSEFSNVLKFHKLDYKNNLTFAGLYVQEKNLGKLMKVLEFEFEDFFKKI
jgi:hypothetical protein